eukprot:1147241-Pelagomonas_calceolata.AAC.1
MMLSSLSAGGSVLGAVLQSTNYCKNGHPWVTAFRPHCLVNWVHSREPPSPEVKKEANVGRVDFWQHSAPGHQHYGEIRVFLSKAHLVEGMGSIYGPTYTQEDCVESGSGTLKMLAQFTLPDWNCAASYLFVTCHTAEYPM